MTRRRRQDLAFQTARFVQPETLSMPDVVKKPASDPAGFTRSEYDINGVKTVVQSIGSGPVLVFLHGTGTFTGFEVARAWAAHHTVLIPFHPGFGDSGDSDTIDTIEDHVLHYMDLFDRLGLRNFDLAGFSLGGWLAAEFTIRQPQRGRDQHQPALWSTPRPRRDCSISPRRICRPILPTIRWPPCATFRARRIRLSRRGWDARSRALQN